MQISFTSFILIPLLFSLVGIFVCWLYYILRRPVRDESGEIKLYRCQVCMHVYQVNRDVPLARCPRCGCLNEAVKR